MAIDKGEVDRIVCELGRNNPRFSRCIRKWIPLLCSTVSRISQVTGCLPEDALQDILVSLAEVDGLHDVPLYRYKKQVYEKVKEDGSLVCLKTPRINKTCYWVWVPAEEVEPLKKGKLESEIYREINQQANDLINAHFTQRNGYMKEPSGSMTVLVRTGSDKFEQKKKTLYEIKQLINFVDVEDALGREFIRDYKWGSNPEDCLIYKQYIESIRARLSENAGKVLNFMMSNVSRSDAKMANALSMKMKEVRKARNEILVVVATQLHKNYSNVTWEFENVSQLCD